MTTSLITYSDAIAPPVLRKYAPSCLFLRDPSIGGSASLRFFAA